MGSPQDESRVVLPSSQSPDQSGGKPDVPVMGTQDTGTVGLGFCSSFKIGSINDVLTGRESCGLPHRCGLGYMVVDDLATVKEK